MGKNKRRQIEVEDTVHGTVLSADSMEEVDFINFLCEACDLSAISDFSYQPQQFQLFEPKRYTDVNGKERCLFREHHYNPDFMVEFNPSDQMGLAEEFKVPLSDLSNDTVSSYIDVKGVFARNDAGNRTFSLNQKWMYDKYGIYVVKVVPKEFFGKFGCPEKCRFTMKTKKPSTKYQGFPSVSDKLRRN